MEIKLTSTTCWYADGLLKKYPQLKLFDSKVKHRKEQDGDLYITLNNLDDLLNLRKAVKKELIVNVIKEKYISIEICDTLRE